MDGAMRVILVTGASSGIGRALALALARPGARLHLSGRSRERLDGVAVETRARGAEAAVHSLDLLDDGAIADLVGELATGGRLDVLIHGAGDVALGRVESAPVSDLDRQYRINTRAPYVLTQRCLPLLRACGGQVVFVNSGAGLNARPEWGQYAMTKHALKALADSLREEVKPFGIRVMSVFPGRTATPMQEEVHRLEGREYDPRVFLQPQDIASQVVAGIDLARTADVTDLILRPARS
jgi:NAD(P)-dependent dehydrogenase (short-subunit alcohol dehydrogenase family)